MSSKLNMECKHKMQEEYDTAPLHSENNLSITFIELKQRHY